jgi:uncharacterized protein
MAISFASCARSRFGAKFIFIGSFFMKILAVSDQVIDRLYSSSVKHNYPDINMIVGCGDLPYSYLEFLVTVLNLPLYYVPGNHDPEHGPSTDSRAEGCTNLDGRVIFTKGLLMAGLGGSILYQPGGPNQYSQSEMYMRAYRLLPKILWSRIRFRRPLDLLITHSPPEGIHDDDDPTHHGLRAINLILRWAQPRFMFHGHTIFYHQNLDSHITTYLGTRVVNVYPFRVMDID